MQENDRDTQMSEGVLVVQSRFSPLGCTGLLIAAMVLFMAVGVRFGRSEVLASESISTDIESREPEMEEEILPEIPAVSPTPTGTPAPLPTETPEPTSAAEVTLTRESGSQRPSLQKVSSPTPTILRPTETPIPLPTETRQRDFTVELRPTPTDNFSTTVKVPILMYHYVSNPPTGADIYRNDLSVLPENFKEHMLYLVEKGYSTIDLYDLSMAITNKKPLPEKPVILTFDDGYIDNYHNAFPVLKELDLVATFFVATGFIDAGNPNYMDWPMLEEMSSAGMRIEPHSKSHPDLRDEERSFLIYEIQGSQETIAAHTGYIPRYFAHPGGRYDEEVIDILMERDFWGAVTTAPGSLHGFDDRYEWTRQRVRITTSLNLFADLVD